MGLSQSLLRLRHQSFEHQARVVGVLGGAGGFHPLGRGEGEQGGFVVRADEFKFVGHGLFQFDQGRSLAVG